MARLSFSRGLPERRLLLGLAASLAVHGLLLLLHFGVPGKGGTGTAPPLTVVLAPQGALGTVVPGPASLAEPAATSGLPENVLPPTPEAVTPATSLPSGAEQTVPPGSSLDHAVEAPRVPASAIKPAAEPAPVSPPVATGTSKRLRIAVEPPPPAARRGHARPARVAAAKRISAPRLRTPKKPAQPRLITQSEQPSRFTVSRPEPDEAKTVALDPAEAQQGTDDGRGRAALNQLPAAADTSTSIDSSPVLSPDPMSETSAPKTMTEPAPTKVSGRAEGEGAEPSGPAAGAPPVGKALAGQARLRDEVQEPQAERLASTVRQQEEFAVLAAERREAQHREEEAERLKAEQSRLEQLRKEEERKQAERLKHQAE